MKKKNKANSKYLSFLTDDNLGGPVKEDVKLRLSNILYGLDEGSDQVVMSPFKTTPEQALKKFDSIFDNLNHSSPLVKDLYELEMSQRDKFGPRSRALPFQEAKEDFLEYFGKEKGDAVINTKNLPKQRSVGLRLCSRETAIKSLKPDTNSGLPYLTKKGSVVQRYTDPGILSYVSVMFRRTQEQFKTRFVWGISTEGVIRAQRIYLPLQSYQRRLKWRSALVGPEAVDRSITQIVLKCVRSDKEMELVSFDAKGYDKSCKRRLQEAANNLYIKGLFQKSHWDYLDEMNEYDITVGIVTPDGVMTGDHGIPSGTPGTNEKDSIIQWLVSLSSGLVTDLDVQGDDGVHLVSKGDGKSLLKYFRSHGIEANIDKTYIRPDSCIYLQKFYSMSYMEDGLIGGIYPIYRALNRIYYPERFVDIVGLGMDGQDYFSIRTITILENCKYHPYFKDFVKFVLSLDKYNLSFSNKGLADYVKYVSSSSGAVGLITNQYGDNVKGIRSFETFKLIKELVGA